MSSPPTSHSDVVIFPPVIPLSGFVLGLVLDRVAPLPVELGGTAALAVRAVGAAVLVTGVAGFAWMIVTMKRAHTPIHNGKPSTTLVETGPFAHTRNPMYLFGSVWYAGLALLLLEVWPLVLLPLVLVVTHHGVVRREEVYLEHAFGEAYTRYKARVPRWL